MKKTFVMLLVLAVGVWGYVVVQVIAVFFGKPSGSESQVGVQRVAMAAVAKARPPLDTAYRDPFQPYLYAQKPAPVRVAAPTPKPAPKIVVIEPPKAVLGGVLGGDPPVAILKQGGQTELVKEGAEVWDLKVIKIERHQVTVEKQGRKFTLAY
jgi:hypothetical protein